jgi:hypothetical protein
MRHATYEDAEVEISPVGRERDVAIAEACGWEWETAEIARCGGNVYQSYFTPPVWTYPNLGASWRRGKEFVIQIDEVDLSKVPFYSTNLTAAFTLGEEAVRLGFAEEYICALCFSVNWNVRHRSPSYQEQLDLAHASADVRSAAWLATYREWKEVDG